MQAAQPLPVSTVAERPLLRLEHLQASYGPVQALRDVSLTVPLGKIVCVLGANGAGKSTTLRCISGLLRTGGGLMEYDGVPLGASSPERRVRLGIAQVPEGRQIFTQLTVIENLKLGAYTRGDRGTIAADLEAVFGYFPILGRRRQQTAGTLSGGEQQMLAIGRALMARPRLLLLDEPSLGLAPMLVRDIFENIRRISRDQRLTVLIVEQDAAAALAIADFGYVLEVGSVMLSGEAAALRENEGVRRSYLGY